MYIILNIVFFINFYYAIIILVFRVIIYYIFKQYIKIYCIQKYILLTM